MAARKGQGGPAADGAAPRAQLGRTYLAVNSSNVSSWPCDASGPSLSAASFALVLRALEPATVTPGTGTAGREQRGAAWWMEWDRKKVERAATRRRDADDIRKVGRGTYVAGLGTAFVVGIEVFEMLMREVFGRRT
jgi:hypothetical protein